MIGFNNVVQILAGSVFCVCRQLVLALQPADLFRVGDEFVGGNRT